MFVLRGTVVTMRPDGQVLPGGEVYVGDDGLIAAVTPIDAVPAGFENAPRITAGGLIYPGLIDLHNHLMYNSLPLVDRAFAHEAVDLAQPVGTGADVQRADQPAGPAARCRGRSRAAQVRRDPGDRRRYDVDPGQPARRRTPGQRPDPERRLRETRHPRRFHPGQHTGCRQQGSAGALCGGGRAGPRIHRAFGRGVGSEAALGVRVAGPGRGGETATGRHSRCRAERGRLRENEGGEFEPGLVTFLQLLAVRRDRGRSERKGCRSAAVHRLGLGSLGDAQCAVGVEGRPISGTRPTRCSPTRNWCGWRRPTRARRCPGSGRIRSDAWNVARWPI